VAGAQQSFEEFVPRPYRCAGDHHPAEDLVQQALLRVAGRWPGSVPGSAPC
jgi:DNA-directed RNA polymerase specialized sigma24 family protein